MLTYTISRSGDSYRIVGEGRKIIEATRKSRVFGDIVSFYDNEGQEIIRAKHRLLFFFFSRGHKITFYKENFSTLASRKRGHLEMEYRQDRFTLKHGLFGISESLFKNGEPVGNYKVIASKIGSFTHVINSIDHLSCKLFSILDIVDDWFDVN